MNKSGTSISCTARQAPLENQVPDFEPKEAPHSNACCGIGQRRLLANFAPGSILTPCSHVRLSDATEVLNRDFKPQKPPLCGRDGNGIERSNNSEKLWELSALNPCVSIWRLSILS